MSAPESELRELVAEILGEFVTTDDGERGIAIVGQLKINRWRKRAELDKS